MSKENIIEVKSYQFAIDIVKTCRRLVEKNREFILSKQLMRSGTSIGANIKEAEHAQSKADFLNKMNIALKEANETSYWLMLLKDTDYISVTDYKVLNDSCEALISILVKIVISTKKSLGRLS
jgi:four helix bundle protein